jgi:hypothetical protein
MFPNEMKRRLKENLIEIGLTTQLHGIPKIFNNKHKSLKILWLICFILSISFCINYLIQTINGYLKYPIITNIITIQQNPMPMPVITICDLNTPLTNFTVKDKIISCIFNGYTNCSEKFIMYYDNWMNLNCYSLDINSSITRAGFFYGFEIKFFTELYNENLQAAYFPSNGIIVFIHNQTNYPTRDDGKYYKKKIY